MTSDGISLSRRHLLAGAGALFSWALVPQVACANGRDPRLLVIVLRGALDGLATVAPVGDPKWSSLRGEEGLRLGANPAALPLDTFFALNPAMPNLHRLFKKSQAAIIHACASPYRDRSHFDGQDVLESGLTVAGRSESGWLNRALLATQSGGRVDPRQAMAVGPMTPLIVRGSAPVLLWTPPRGTPTSNDTTRRLMDLYRHTDPAMEQALEEGIGLKAVAAKTGMDGGDQEQQQANVRSNFAESAGAAAKLLAKDGGPRIGALSLYGWDTHAKEGTLVGRLATTLGGLDAAIAAIEKESGLAWKEMVVVLITEFGRTARINGTAGTDHGTATVALLVGGAVKGGRVIADWPGLKEGDLYDGRDLKPTTDLRAVLKGVLKEHIALGDAALSSKVFPGSEAVKPTVGLIT